MRQRKDHPDLGNLAFLGFLISLGFAVALSQCHHATAPETGPSEARIIDTGRATCEPWPQCQDVEPPKRPGGR